MPTELPDAQTATEAAMPSDGRARVVIEAVSPSVDGGRFAAKRCVGDTVVVEADVFGDGHDLVAGRIVVHDPEGAEAWDGTMRLVAYIQADLDSSEAVDPLLPEVAWSWLVDALAEHTDQVTALGGTVTATTSVRYGDISGPPRAHQLELRASWTATSLALGPHVAAFCEVLEHAAGLPPTGVTDLGSRTRDVR